MFKFNSINKVLDPGSI